MKKKTLAVLVNSVFIFFISSCQNHQSQSADMAPIAQDSQNIMSTRGKASDQFFMFLRLKTDALLIQAKQVNGVTVIDTQQMKKIEQEQQDLIDNLKLISTDIQIVYRYKLVLNGIAVVGPKAIQSKVISLSSIASYEEVGRFDREINQESTSNLLSNVNFRKYNSSQFIGAEKLHQLGITGHGVKIGVLDTGIDYTHVMLGGPGSVQAFRSVDPKQTHSLFPNQKVVGGIDLVGSDFDAASLAFKYRVPRPDPNPIDEATHGTHVAATIAGIGDYINSYNGVAPDASLFAIKVFGKSGSTSDMVVIAGLEYAIDPNGDGDLSDQLDIVNLSLGSGYGNPKVMYAEALKNVVNAGTVAVVAAGNSGNKDYIVGTPGTSTEALSVASGVDDTEHNWKYNASQFEYSDKKIYVEAIEATTSKKIVDSPVTGELYDIGYADKDLTQEQSTQLNGKVALIDRGIVNFDEKIKRAAEAGAIGVVVVSGKGQSVISMGTVAHYDIPAIMINYDVGSEIKTALQSTNVTIRFLADQMIEKKENIDRISTFSSRGPRSMDGFLKPEITAPGQSIVSAEAGTGDKVIQKSGTSMATPHVAGVIALLKQKFQIENKKLNALELKNIVMGTSKVLFDQTAMYPLSRQGAGRIQAGNAAESKVVADVPSFSFGEVNINQNTQVEQNIKIKNISKSELDLSLQFAGSAAVKMQSIQKFRLSEDGQIDLNVKFDINESLLPDVYRHEVQGFVNVIDNSTKLILYKLPLLIVLYKNSIISIDKFAVSKDVVNLDISNKSINQGDVQLFNFLSLDGRKSTNVIGNEFMTTDCDLQSAGYRIISKKNADGEDKKVIQFAVKVYKPMTTWQSCDVSVLFYSDKKMPFDQELVATQLSTVIPKGEKKLSSILIDANEARSIRNATEREVEINENNPILLNSLKDMMDYTLAISDFKDIRLYNNSTLMVLEADLDLISKNDRGDISFQILTSHYDQSVVQFDNYLYKDKSKLITVSSDLKKQPFYNFSEVENVKSFTQKTITLKKGSGLGDLIGYYPMNSFSMSDNLEDQQSQILKTSK